MKKIGGKDLCPCGSGRKYKNCCGAGQPPDLEGLPEGIRMKGGIRYDPMTRKYLVIVHIWDNVECRGEPEEWNYPQAFQTEDEAMAYYKTAIGPALKRRLEKSVEGKKDAAFYHRKLE